MKTNYDVLKENFDDLRKAVDAVRLEMQYFHGELEGQGKLPKLGSNPLQRRLICQEEKLEEILDFYAKETEES